MSTVCYEFFQTPEHLRRVGASGGRATARNRRDRLSSAAPAPPPEGHAALTNPLWEHIREHVNFRPSRWASAYAQTSVIGNGDLYGVIADTEFRNVKVEAGAQRSIDT